MHLFKTWISPSTAKLVLFLLILPNMIMFFLPGVNIEVSAGYFGIEPNDVQFLIMLYYVGFAAFYSLERRFYNYFTAKHYYLLFQLIQIICCAALYKIQIPAVLFIVRFVQGMLFASAVNLYLSIASSYMKNARAKEISFSLFFGMLLATSAFNNLITADIIDQFNFDIVFKAALLIYALGIVIVLVGIKKHTVFTKHRLSQLDIESFALLAITLLCYGYCSIYGQQYYWMESRGINAAILLGSCALISFVLRQRAIKRPYINLDILRVKKYWICLLVLFFMYIERFSVSFFTTFYLQVFKMDPRHVSYIFVLDILGIAIGVSLGAWYQIKEHNTIYLWIAGFCVLLIHHLLLSQMLYTSGNETYFMLPLGLHGLGIGLIMVPTIITAMGVVPYYIAPSAAAFALLARFTGYATSNILTKYFSVHNYNLHYQRFVEYISTNNSFYQQQLLEARQKVIDHGAPQSQASALAQKIAKDEVDTQILLRSIMDYYTLMNLPFCFYFTHSFHVFTKAKAAFYKVPTIVADIINFTATIITKKACQRLA